MQDVEFTIEQGKLWILQTRKANRTSEAAFRIAVEMIEDEELSIQDVLDDGRLSSLDWFSVKGRSIKSAPKPTYIGLAAGSGIAQGRAVFTSQEAVDATDPVILVRPETIPDDIAGMYNAEGIVTFEGGMTSHAAVVARGMNKPCIVGVTEMAGKIMVGDMITIDSANGLIWVNSEIEINDRGGSVYADKYIMLVQNHWDVLVGRNRYMSNSVLTISQMSDVEFESMIEQVTKTGDWLDNVYLVTSAVPSYFEDDTPLNKFADLAASDTLYPMTAKRVDKIKALKSDALYFEDAPIVASISQMENSSTWVRLDIEAFEGFLGSKSKEIISQMENWECSQKVLDWVQDEEQFALGVFE
jgi:phosphohistidine swiveling domain-containing protein